MVNPSGAGTGRTCGTGKTAATGTATVGKRQLSSSIAMLKGPQIVKNSSVHGIIMRLSLG